MKVLSYVLRPTGYKRDQQSHQGHQSLELWLYSGDVLHSVNKTGERNYSFHHLSYVGLNSAYFETIENKSTIICITSNRRQVGPN